MHRLEGCAAGRSAECPCCAGRSRTHGNRTAGIQHDGGSLTIHTSNEEPANPTARANWLPAPSGPFRLVMRLYNSGPSILDGTYQFPPITKN